MKKNWQFIKEEKAYSDNILSIRHLEYYYKVADKSMVFTVQDMSSWAIIVPVTKDGEFILVRQFRAGTNSDTLEFPGGSINKNEDVMKAAARELQEETGAVSNKIIPLGVIDPNPAFMTNKCHVFAALDCSFDGVQELDLFEDTEALTVKEDKLRQMLKTGEFSQSLSIAAYSLYKTIL